MATRKSRQNTESPTPSGTESVPTTPTTPATRNTRSIRNKQLQQVKIDEPIQIKTEKIDEEEEAVKDTNTEDEESATPNVETKESIEQIDKETESSPPAASTRKRRIAAAKEENSTDKPAISNETASPNTPDDVKTSPNKNKRARRSAFAQLTDSKPESTPSILSKRRNSTGRIEKPTRKLSSRIKKLKQLRKTPLGRAMLKKPEKTAIAVNKPIKQLIEKQITKSSKVDKSDSASDSELIKMSRRRSDSVSKCSDMTDASSFQETKDSVEDLLTQTSETSDGKVVVKEENADKEELEKDELDNKAPENELAEPTRSVNDSGIGGDSDNSQVAKIEGEQTNDSKRPSRFTRRKRQLNPPRGVSTRSRSETPSKAASENQDDDEEDAAIAKEIKKESIESDAPLHIDTTITESNANDKLSPELEQPDKETVANEKAKSLSPVLVSEGVSEISVKQFYGQADFLENNLGIEKDPKLGEIVQSQEKIIVDSKENGDKCKDNNEKLGLVCAETEITDDTEEPSETNEVQEIDTSTESMDVDETGADADKKIDGAKCDEINAMDSVECFVKPTEISRRASATILNENLLVLNGEIEITSKKEKKEVIRPIEEDVGEVVLYKITNGMRVNPENLETVRESQKFKEKERSDSTESANNGLTIDETECVDKNKTDAADNYTKEEKDTKKIKAKSEEPVRSNSMEFKLAGDSDTNKENVIKPAAIRSNSSSKDSRSSSLDDESPEEKIQKESHLKTLGLLTHQAAEEATIEKQKQREKMKAKGKKHSEYTGTLKTVIKLHRGGGNDKKKGNQSLKMTLHKGRAKNGSDKSDSHSIANSEEDTYYTIQQQDIDGIGKRNFLLMFEF